MLNRIRRRLSAVVRKQAARMASADAAASTSAKGGVIDDGRHIVLDYPIHPRPRFGHEQPPHPQMDAIIRAGTDRYRARLEAIVAMQPWLLKIPVEDTGDLTAPFWRNPWLPGLDAAALYTFVASEKPTTYLEVGSGTSTKFTRQAISDHGLSTRIVSIDPQPRAEIDAICDEVIRSPLEDADLSVFEGLVAGDVVFIDNSHRVFTNSDACVVFLEVLPRLAPGVLVEIHDIYLPDDYPAGWNDRFYTEQYVLAGYLLGGSQTFETELPNWFITTNPDLAEVAAPLWAQLPGAEALGGSYWLRMT
jgi:hypothetical protein